MSREPPRDPDATRTRLGQGQGTLEPGTLLAGRYRIVELRGVGGMGFVYRALDQELDVEVAVKVLRPDRAAEHRMLERFRQELLLARQVSHPNVVRIHDIGRHEDLWFLTMDYVPGRSLKDVLRQEGALSPERAAAIVREVALALEVAHAQGVVHRDLKPGNVLLDDRDRPYVTDFGVARSIAETGLTRPGDVVGTPDYLAPEQARGEPVDHRADLYALGLILFEMLTGELPFSGGSYSEVLAQRISGRPRTLADSGVDVPHRLQGVVEKLLERDPDDRFQSGAEVAAALEGHPVRRRLPRLRFGPRVAVSAAVLALVALGLVVWWLRTGRDAEPSAAASAALGVAVLPMVDETGREELAWAATGLAEMVARNLSETPALRVVDSLRVLRTVEDLNLEERTLAAEELRPVAELLDVDRLVLGRIRSTSTGLRVDGRLLAYGPGASPEQSFAVEASDREQISALVGDVSREVRRRLEVPLDGAPAPPLSTSTEALAHYARGVEKLSRGASVEAVGHLEAATEADPAMPAAWLRLADAYQRTGRWQEALEAVRRTLTEMPQGAGRLAYEARAREASLSGDPRRAAELWGVMVRRYPEDVEAKIHLGEVLGDQGRLDEAAEVLQEVVDVEPHHPRAWFLLGKFAILAGESRRAIDDYLVHALVVQNRLGNLQGKGDVVNALGIAHQDLGNWDEAAQHFEEAVAIRRDVGDLRGVAGSLNNLATVEALQGDYQEARSRLEQSLEISRDLGDRAGMAQIHNTLGVFEEERGAYREALEAFRQALTIRRDLGDERALAESLTNVGFSYFLLGDYDNAEVYADRALELYREQNNPEGIAQALQSRGQLQMVRGRWTEALESFLEALELARDLDFPVLRAVSLGNLGRVAQLQGRYRAALESYQDALAVLGEVGDVRGLSEYTLYEASALVDLDRLGPAAEALERVRAWQEEGGTVDQRAELRRLEARTALAQGRHDDARVLFDQALEIAEGAATPADALASRIGLAQVDLAVGEAGAATESLRALEPRVDALGHVPLALDLACVRAEAELAAGRSATAETVARRGLRLARKHEPVAVAFRLHLYLSRALETQGEPGEAARSWAAAAAQVERLRDGLTDEERDSFAGRSDVRAILENAPETSPELRSAA